MIKGNKYGFQIVLDPDLTFDDLLQHVNDKFHKSRGFFDKNRPIAVNFKGRELSDEEQDQLVEAIAESGEIQISYIIDGGKAVETEFADALSEAKKEEAIRSRFVNRVLLREETVEKEKAEEKELTEEEFLQEAFTSGPKIEKNGQFYRGTLRSGQCIEVDGSIVILGDINPGAQVIAGGNVVVLGNVKGMITAGFPEDESAVVAALIMEPMQIKIGNIIARSPDQKNVGKIKKKFRKKPQVELEPKLAFVENGNIFIEPITRSLISEFSTK